MATLQAAATLTGAIVSDPQAVRQLCENYCFGTLDWDVTSKGEFTIWGHDDFEVYEARENGLPDYEGCIVTNELLQELTDYSNPTRNLMSRLQDPPNVTSPC